MPSRLRTGRQPIQFKEKLPINDSEEVLHYAAMHQHRAGWAFFEGLRTALSNCPFAFLPVQLRRE
eukprot:3679364-Amphidinium_carterae.1